MLQWSCQQAHDGKALGSARKNDSARVPQINATQNAIESIMLLKFIVKLYKFTCSFFVVVNITNIYTYPTKM